jgi:hypothetical protein
MAARKIAEVNGNKVYWCAEWQEYSVVWAGTTRSHASTYYTQDNQDALDTAASLPTDWRE